MWDTFHVAVKAPINMHTNDFMHWAYDYSVFQQLTKEERKAVCFFKEVIFVSFK